MALIKCNECGKEISDGAKICPHCGSQTEKYKKEKAKKVKVITIGAIILISIIGVTIGFGIYVNNLVASREASSSYRYGIQSINILEKYINGEISNKEAESSLENIQDLVRNKMDSLTNEDEDYSKLLFLSIELGSTTWDLLRNDVSLAEEHVEEIKDIINYKKSKILN